MISLIPSLKAADSMALLAKSKMAEAGPRLAGRTGNESGSIGGRVMAVEVGALDGSAMTAFASCPRQDAKSDCTAEQSSDRIGCVADLRDITCVC
jgi:hypothetical protein